MNEAFWAGVYRAWLWLGVPFMLAAAAAICLLAVRIAALVRRALLFRAPLAASQPVGFSAAGPVVLSIEGPRLTRRFAGVRFELRTPDGRPIEGRRAWLRARTSGFRRVRIELLKYDIPGPGRYVLATTGLGAARAGDASHAIVFMKPHLGRAAACILGIVLASLVFIPSLVFFVMRLVETQTGH